MMNRTSSPLSSLLNRVRRALFSQPPMPSNHIWMQQQIIENSPFGLVMVDAQQHDLPIVYVNGAFERFTGYTMAEVVGKNCRFLQGNDRNQPEGELIREAIQKHQPVVAVLRNYRKDGSMFWNEVHINPVFDEAGKLTHFVGVQHDITARKEAESALARSEDRYRQMFEGNRAVKLVIDPATGMIEDANSAAVQFYGYSYAQLTSMHIQEINMLPATEVSTEMQRAVTQERTYFEFRHRLASGDIREVDVFSSYIDLPVGRRLYSVIVDVTGKRDGERRYRALFEQSNDAVFILNLQGDHLFCNHRAAEMLGYGDDEVAGMGYRDVVVPEEQAQSRAMFQRLAEGERLPPYERTFHRKDGTPLPVEINIELIRDSAGNPWYCQSIVRDITPRKQAQQQEFLLALERERAQLLTKFVHDAAHEFRTPLSVISANAYLVARLPDAQRRHEKAEQIQLHVKLISRLVDNLLMMAKLEDSDSMQKIPVDVRTLLMVDCANVARSYGECPVLSYDLPPDLPHVFADADYLSVAFRHFLDNAYRFTPTSGTISVSGCRDGERIRVEVRDTGVGIAPEDLSHIFEMFWRRDTSHSTPGFGLGLSIAQRIIEFHDGTITVESRVNQGTTVSITLPINR